MEYIFDRLFQIISLEYMLSVILASYFVIKGVDMLNGTKAVPTWIKRLITFGVGIFLFLIFYRFTETSLETLITSYFVAVFFYDAVIKFCMKKLDIDYRTEDADIH